MAYATYRGGREREPGRSIAMDPDGNASVAGGTRSTDFPVTPVAAQTANGGGHDASIAKPDPTGQPLLVAPRPGGGSSAELHSAVSRIWNPQALWQANGGGLPTLCRVQLGGTAD